MSKLTDEWGFFTPMPECVIERTAELGSDVVFLFMYFRYRTNKKRGCAFPAYKQMREDLGWGRTRIKAAVDRLEEFKYLRRRKRFGKSTEYFLTRPPDMGGTEGEDTTSIPVAGILHENDGTVFPQRDSSIPAAGLSVFPPTEQDSRLSLTKTESTQTELKDSPAEKFTSFSQDQLIKAKIEILNQMTNNKPHMKEFYAPDYDKYYAPTWLAGARDGIALIVCVGEDPEYQKAYLSDRASVFRSTLLIDGEQIKKVHFVTEAELEE